MKRIERELPLRIAGLSLALLISACGGGGSTSGPVTLAGNVIDGYITGAKVCLDINGNGVCDSGEPTATSGANGAYSISVPTWTNLSSLHLLAVVPVGAIDADAPTSPITAPYTMLAPAQMPMVISPLTTAVSTHMIADGMSIANARIQARSDLNLPIAYDFLKDHVAANDVPAQNVAKVIAAILANSVGTAAPSATNLAQALTEAKTYSAQATTATDVTGLVSSLGPVAGGFTRTCGSVATQNCISFGESTLAFDAFEGLGSATVVADPQNPANKVAKLVKVSSGQPWAGATLYTTASNRSVSSIGFGASKVVTLRVYSSAIGEKIRVKVEDAADGAKSMEADALTTKANEWETLSFDFTTPAAGAFSATTNYNKISVFPKFLTAVTADTSYYFDELSYAKVPGNTGNCTTTASQNCLTFGESTLALTPFGGAASASVANDPLSSSNKVVKMTKASGDPTWAGVTIATTASDSSVARAGFDTSKVATLRVLSPAAGQKIRMKFESASDPTKTIEVDATTTKANEWETLSFDFTTPAAGTAAYASANTYNKVSVFPNFGVSPTADANYYFDELSYAAYVSGGGSSGSGGSGGSTGTPLIFASNYTDQPTAWKSTEGGDAGTYIDTGVTTQYWWSGVAAADATPSFYFGYGTDVAHKPWGFGAYVKAPGNGTAVIGSYANLKLAVWGNDQLTSTNPTFTVILKGPTVSACTSELKSTLSVAAVGVQNYTLPLSGFALQTACGYSSVAAALAAGVTEVHIQVLGNNLQYTSGGDPNGFYPNGLNVGPISFSN